MQTNSKHYLQTVSALAMGSVAVYGGSVATAQADDGFSLTFLGGLGDVTGGLEAFGSGGVPELGQFGGVVLGTTFGNMDASISYRQYNQSSAGAIGSGFFASSSGSGGSGGSGYSYLYGQAYEGSETNWSALDMNVTLPSGIDDRLQWIAGLRMLQYDNSAFVGVDFTYGESGGISPFGPEQGFYETYASTEFVGMGPRFAARYSTGPIAGQFGFTGEIGAALLYGRLEENVGFAVDSGGGTPFVIESGYSEMTYATAVDLSLQADYYISDNSSFFVALQSQQMLSLSDLSDEDGRTETFLMGFTTEF